MWQPEFVSDSNPKFPVGVRVAVKGNLTLRGKVVDVHPAWQGASGLKFSANYDVVIDGEKNTRNITESSLVLESAVFDGQTQMSFSNKHLPDRVTREENCQLFLAFTGSKEHIRKQLQRMLDECNDSYGKPRQGVFIESHGTLDVITPVWEGKKY